MNLIYLFILTLICVVHKALKRLCFYRIPDCGNFGPVGYMVDCSSINLLVLDSNTVPVAEIFSWIVIISRFTAVIQEVLMV